MRAFESEAVQALAGAYPERPVRLEHNLVGHPLLTVESLAALAHRIAPETIEYNRGDVPIGLDPAVTPANGLSIAETIRSIEECGSWMVLKFLERDPLYAGLLHDLLGEIREVVAPVTGPMLRMEAFAFLSSPGSVTPYHFDPEHNILLQIRGRKTMTIFPADDERLAPGTEHERFHGGGHRNLPWRDEFAGAGQAFELTPGRAVYVPVKAPHWVQNGPEVSISLSITWRSAWSYREEDAHQMNSMMRNLGMRPGRPRRFPADNRLKSLGFRAIRKVRTLTGLER